ncbi:MAG: DUF2726 domain-containing protein, partial [Ottowia sp.]|nr:DUF2726 domain-containing protein [Ottowia sp.]
GFFFWQMRREGDVASLRDNTYTLKEVITPPQKELLFYLEQAFQGQVVLFRPSLAQLVQIQQTDDRIRSQTLLDTIRVDYVVCNNEGKIRYAFDVRQRGAAADDPTQKKIVTVKQRVLRGVGVKLMGIQRSVSKMPPVSKFAHQLSMALGEPSTVTRDSTLRPAFKEAAAPQPRPEPKLGSYEPPSQEALASEMAMLTDIMGLSPESDSGSSGMSGMSGMGSAS